MEENKGMKELFAEQASEDKCLKDLTKDQKEVVIFMLENAIYMDRVRMKYEISDYNPFGDSLSHNDYTRLMEIIEDN